MSGRILASIRRLRDCFLESHASTLGIPLELVPQSQSLIDEAFAAAIADEFEAALHAPSDSTVQASYQQFCHEIVLQWNCLRDGGLTIEPWTSQGQPYRSSLAMQADVASGHVYFFLTSSGHGEDADGLDQSANPLLADSGIVLRRNRLVINDLLRVVHDVFGHAQEGHQFGPLGEENAWQCHRTMFSSLAAEAMTTETRGQNSWFNFGPHLRTATGAIIRPGQPDYVHPSARPFALQKMTLLPSWCSAPTAGVRPGSPASLSSVVPQHTP